MKLTKSDIFRTIVTERIVAESLCASCHNQGSGVCPKSSGSEVEKKYPNRIDWVWSSIKNAHVVADCTGYSDNETKEALECEVPIGCGSVYYDRGTKTLKRNIAIGKRN